MASEWKPRLCVITKGENGYGFHLHAEASGLRPGDRVVAVNGVNVERETHHQVVQRIKTVEHETRLLVVDHETHESLRSLRLTATEAMAIHGTGPASSSSPPAEAHTQAQSESQPQVDPSTLAPRLCHLVKSEAGYGFNLHSDRSRPGQYIRSLDPGSPADHAGLRPQDRLIEVNGVNIEGMRHAEVVAFIKKGGDETWLLVVDPDTDEHFKRRGVIPTTMMVRPYPPNPKINGSSTTQSLRSTHSNFSSQGNSTQLADDEGARLLDPFAEMGLRLSATAAEEKMKAHAKEKKRAPQMDWMKKYELFSNF
uniref:PDZ domain-containing protein n=1 Tax=Monopterus albus TaxID=43700 RepID=A0A3Q3J0B4_MONAL